MSYQLDPVARRRRLPFLSILAILIALGSLAFSFWQSLESRGGVRESVSTRWQEAKRRGVIRVGYGGFPPYTIVNPDSSDPGKHVTGFTVDLINEIAARAVPPMRVEWQQFSWDSMKGDLAADRFAFIGDAVYQTIPRATDFLFTEPYSYFGIAVGLVRKDDDRFKQYKDLDREGITIALAEGYTSTEFARATLSKPTFKLVPVTGDAFTQLDEVLLGRADAALNDVPTVLQYARAHGDRVKALWIDNPPSTVAAGFLLRTEDPDLKAFLDVGIRVLSLDGTIARLDGKWKGLGSYILPTFTPGSGLKKGEGAELQR